MKWNEMKWNEMKWNEDWTMTMKTIIENDIFYILPSLKGKN